VCVCVCVINQNNYAAPLQPPVVAGSRADMQHRKVSIEQLSLLKHKKCTFKLGVIKKSLPHSNNMTKGSSIDYLSKLQCR